VRAQQTQDMSHRFRAIFYETANGWVVDFRGEEIQCNDEAMATRLSGALNTQWNAGYQRAQQDMRDAIGVR